MEKSAHDTLDERSFRDVMGRYATGVVLLTAQSADGPTGIAAIPLPPCPFTRH